MANNDRIKAVAAPPRTPDEEDDKFMTPEMAVGQDPRRRPFHPDPETGEVPAGPGDAGLGDRPALNAGSPGTKQMSNRRLAIGLGLATSLAILVFIFAVIF